MVDSCYTNSANCEGSARIQYECQVRAYIQTCGAHRLLVSPYSAGQCVSSGDRASINGAAGNDRPELFDAVVADADIPVVEVDGRVAVAGDQADLVAEPEPVGGGGDGEAAVLVGGALVGRGGLVADERRAGIEGHCLEAGVDD